MFNLTVGPSYAIFPFRPQYETDPIPQVWQGLKFDLEVEMPKNPDLKRELLASLHAWANFGGLGSRTRRGCGALYCAKLALPVTTARPFALPYHAPFTIYLAKPSETAWKSAISVFQKFRQDPVGRNGMSRSFWPAADSLRAIAGMGQPDHMDSLTLNDPAATPHFPGAEFGLPIVYHFKGSKPSPSRAEFDDGSVSGTLYPAAGESSASMQNRMSSPLILRPLKTADGVTYPCIVRLPWDPPKFLRYKFEMKASDQVRKNISLPEWTGPYFDLTPDWFQPDAEIVGDIKGFGSTIDAFLRYACDGKDNKVAAFEKVYPKP